MIRSRKHPRRGAGARHGTVSVIALAFLGVFVTLALACATFTESSLNQAQGHARMASARLQAESGLAYTLHLVRNAPAPSGDVLDSLATHIAGTLNGSPSLGGASVTYDGNTLTIPAISLGDDGESFTCAIVRSGTDGIMLLAAGSDGIVSRGVGVEARLEAGASLAFANGIISNGPIDVGGNAQVTGVNEAWEANIFTNTSETAAITLGGTAHVHGDAFASNPSAEVSLSGNSHIAGHDRNSDELGEHVHIGVPPVELPEADPTVFEPFATCVMNPSTRTNGNYTHSNLRIPAGTNPHFSGNYTLRGVIYIESPNEVRFDGNCTIQGVVVTEDAGDDAWDDNVIEFRGNTTIQDVESLPEEPQFSDLRQMPGTFLLAPGFHADFRGNFGVIGGAIAAEHLTFTGNSGGTIRGSMLNYGTDPLVLWGNSHFQIDQSSSPETPPGFSTSSELVVLPESYVEQ